MQCARIRGLARWRRGWTIGARWKGSGHPHILRRRAGALKSRARSLACRNLGYGDVGGLPVARRYSLRIMALRWTGTLIARLTLSRCGDRFQHLLQGRGLGEKVIEAGGTRLRTIFGRFAAGERDERHAGTPRL